MSTVLKTVAVVVAAVEACAVLSFSLGIFEFKSLTGSLLGLARSWFPRKPDSLPAAPVQACSVPLVPLPSTPAFTHTAEEQVASEVECEAGLAAQPSEISFVHSNALAAATTGGDELDAVAEGSSGEEMGEDEDAFEDCSTELELVFEPSSNGTPGMRMLQRGLSGLAVRTDPAANSGAPLLVSNYEGRFIEIVNGKVTNHASVDPTYMDAPCATAAHSPRQTASRSMLGPVASVSLSPISSSTKL